MSYTVKIIDNENGLTVVDSTDARGVIGVVITPEGVQGVYSTACKAEEIAIGIFGVQQVCDIAKKKNPIIGMMAAFAEMNKDKIPGMVVDMSQFMGNEKGD